MLLSIDPGAGGGIVLANNKGQVKQMHKMPETDEDTHQLICDLVGGKSITCFIEKLPLFTGQAQLDKNMNSAKTAKMYGNYKLCVGLALGMDFKLIELTPVKWQNLVGCRNFTNLDTQKWKRRLKLYATKLYPEQQVTLWNADALLILRAGLKL